MFDSTPTRRKMLKAIGGTAAVAAVSASAQASDEGWTVVETPTASALRGVSATATVHHAVGEGGIVLERGREGWRKVLDGGFTVGGGGKLYEYDGERWTAVDTPTGENLQAVLRSDPDVAVGADGTVLEH